MYSQRTILLKILKDSDGFKNGKMAPVKKISKKAGERAVATIEFLVDHYGMEVFQPYIEKDLTQVSDSISKQKGNNKYDYTSRYEQRTERIKWFVGYLGLNKFSGYRYDSYPKTDQDNLYYFFSSQQNGVTDVKGYDFIIDNITIQSRTDNYLVDQIKIKTVIDQKGYFSINLNRESAKFDLKILLASLIQDEAKLKGYLDTKKNQYDTYYTLPSTMLSFDKETKSYLITFKATDVRLSIDQNKKIRDITYLSGMYLIKKK
jgi:hypothetical protein